ncbi:hypothetical protein [Pseudoxanthomonas sp.]|jgi:hypothetical protein|uniref:hypothetical protein n=1 Tax=Pseudoxanthomonas sp. TaxID=1871049 RepID=UPI002E10811B|nr:hypothetical protein [Pseudoxanthomonas sp.]
MVALLGLVACTGMRAGQAGDEAAPSAIAASGAFDGEWAACHGETPPDQCSRYVLLQRGDRICGTWFHFATGKEYRGRIVARADSSTEARRTHVCGRRSVESDTECEDGWQRIDKPLRLCKGRLSDRTRADGSCSAYYRSVPLADDARDALLEEPWMQACLSGEP